MIFDCAQKWKILCIKRIWRYIWTKHNGQFCDNTNACVQSVISQIMTWICDILICKYPKMLNVLCWCTSLFVLFRINPRTWECWCHYPRIRKVLRAMIPLLLDIKQEKVGVMREGKKSRGKYHPPMVPGQTNHHFPIHQDSMTNRDWKTFLYVLTSFSTLYREPNQVVFRCERKIIVTTSAKHKPISLPMNNECKYQDRTLLLVKCTVYEARHQCAPWWVVLLRVEPCTLHETSFSHCSKRWYVVWSPFAVCGRHWCLMHVTTLLQYFHPKWLPFELIWFIPARGLKVHAMPKVIQHGNSINEQGGHIILKEGYSVQWNREEILVLSTPLKP